MMTSENSTIPRKCFSIVAQPRRHGSCDLSGCWSARKFDRDYLTPPEVSDRELNYENLIRKSTFCHFGPFPFDVKIERQKSAVIHKLEMMDDIQAKKTALEKILKQLIKLNG